MHFSFFFVNVEKKTRDKEREEERVQTGIKGIKEKKMKKKIFFRRKMSQVFWHNIAVTINPFSIPVQTMFS